MKQTLIILAVIMIAGCSYHVPELDDYTNIVDFQIFMSGIAYCYDWQSEGERGLDYWQSPKETMELMSGDCDDFAILNMYFLHELFDVKPDMVLIWVNGVGPHYYAEHDGIIYDFWWTFTEKKYPVERTELFRYSYDFVMMNASNFYTRSIK